MTLYILSWHVEGEDVVRSGDEEYLQSNACGGNLDRIRRHDSVMMPSSSEDVESKVEMRNIYNQMPVLAIWVESDDF